MQNRTNDHILKNSLGKLFKLPKAELEGSLGNVMDAIDGTPNHLPCLMEDLTILDERFRVIPGVLEPRPTMSMIKQMLEYSRGRIFLVTDGVIGGSDGLFLATIVDKEEVSEMTARLVKGMSNPGLIMGNLRLRGEACVVIAAPLKAFA